jgi:hypothetical protein
MKQIQFGEKANFKEATAVDRASHQIYMEENVTDPTV